MRLVFKLVLVVNITGCSPYTQRPEYVPWSAAGLVELRKYESDLRHRTYVPYSDYYSKWALYVKPGQDVGCQWSPGEEVPLLGYAVNPSELTFDVMHASCHRLVLKNVQTFPGIVMAKGPGVSTVRLEFNIEGLIYSDRNKKLPIDRDGDGWFDHVGESVEDRTQQATNYIERHGIHARLVITAPPCSVYAETKVQQFVIKDVKSESSSSSLFGLVYSSDKSYSEKQYQYDIKHVQTPLTLCIK